MKKKICCVPDIDQVKTGARLKEFRESRHYSVSDIAFFADISDSAVYAWEQGKNLPNLSHLNGLKYLYNLNHLDDLLVLTQLSA